MLLQKYIKLIVGFLFVIISNYSQTITGNSTFSMQITIPDVDYTLCDSAGYKLVDFYNYNDPSKPGRFTLPEKHIIIAIPPNSSPELKFKVINVSKMENSVPVTNSSVFRLNDSTITYKKTSFREGITSYKQKPVVEIGKNFWLRDFYCIELIINSHQFDANDNSITVNKSIDIKLNFAESYNIIDNSPIRIKSKFDKSLQNMIYNSDIAEQFRSFHPIENASATDDWINYNQDYVKLSVGKDGIYRFTQADLTSLGISSSSIDPRTFRLYESGVEQWIYIEDENDASFDEDDYIEFYGIKNYSKIDHREINSSDEPYNTFLNRYTDTTYYFLTWGFDNGKRYSVDNSIINSSVDELEYHTAFRHYELNSFYQNCDNDEVTNQTSNWNKNKNWYWGFIFEGTKNFNVKLDNLYPSGVAKIYSKLTGYASNITTNSHQVTLRFNNEKIDSLNVNRFNQFLLSGTIESQKLSENSNTLSIRNYGNNSVVNSVVYDWYEIEYPRYNKLESDSLIIKVPDGFSNDVTEIKFTNSNSTVYSIYKISPKQKKINNYTLDNGNIGFSDTVSSGDKYVIFSENKVFTPFAKYLGRFTNLRSDNSQTDYLAVTSVRFNSGVTSYVNQINSLFNLSVKIIFVEDIFNEFGFGYSTPEAVKEFIINAYNSWLSPKLSYLTLIGDATYDYKDYTLKNVGVKLSSNYVPSFGNPIGDNWYALWDEEVFIPQLKVGRIPIQNEAQLQYYLDKLTHNSESEFDGWNKRYLFFSGGKGNSPSELQQLKAANDEVISNVIEPRPISGNYYHFYKTSDPVTDFGPYTTGEINTAFDNGGLFISYVGHSGTSTWDNSINDASQLMNNVNRNPVISDFGCSTNKFGEPDIICFGEKFLLYPEGQALNYIGNSSLGFTSTAIPAPKLFYESFRDDSLHEIGNAHIYAKTKLYDIFGSSAVNKVFALSNSILGDPANRLIIPNQPNLLLGNSPLLFESTRIDDSTDSSKVSIIVSNFGSAPSIQFKIGIQHFYKEELLDTKNIIRVIPGFKDTLDVWIKTKELPGEHRLEISLDTDNEIAELDESDNKYDYEFTIYSSALRDLLPYSDLNGKIAKIDLLNPILVAGKASDIILQKSDNILFTDPEEFIFPISKLLTSRFSFAFPEKRYWLRYKLDYDQSEFSSVKSLTGKLKYNFAVNDQFSFNKQAIENLKFSDDKLVLSSDSLIVSVLSAGFYAGGTCVIAENGINILDNNFFSGMGIAVYEPTTMQIDTVTWFYLFDNRLNAEALTTLINNIPEEKIVVIGVANDGQHRLIPELKAAIKTLGSTKIDQLKYRGSWALFGRKGASPGDSDILEEIREPFDGSITLQKDYVVPNQTGILTTTQLGPVSTWDSLYVNYNIPAGASIDVTPIGIRKSEQVDTLDTFNLTSEYTSLSFINPETYPYAKLKFQLTRNENAESPTISTIGVNHVNAPELAINYQTVSLSSDTLIQGEPVEVGFKVSNVGEGVALKVVNKVDLYKDNNFVRTVFDSTYSTVAPNTMNDILFGYTTKLEDGIGNFKFQIILDSRNNNVELYEDNNKFELPFTVLKDTVTSISSAVVSAKFDGYEIYDGDYVSENPTIDIFLDYEGQFEISDTNAIEISLNGNRIDFTKLTTSYDTPNRRITFSYKPKLENGDYILSVLGENIYPAGSDETNYLRFFMVSNENKILYPYNFPNPFVNETHFTFKLTQVPDELKIKIFTIAGRLVRDMKINKEELNIDFNRIFWDGRDEDGDLLANGVYLYKIISYDSEKTATVTSKLAIVR